jgi:hypothetical protein
MNSYALEKIAASYGEERRSAVAATTRVRRARHAECRPEAAAGLARLGGRGRRGGLGAGPVPRPRESQETMTRRAA